MNKIIFFEGSFSKLYSQVCSLHIRPAYTVTICDSVIQDVQMDDITVKKFQFRSCIFYGRSVIDGFRKGDPSRIPDPYSRSTEEGREV